MLERQVIGLLDIKNPINLAGIGLIGAGAYVTYTNVSTLLSNNCFAPGIYTTMGIFALAGGYYLIKVYADNWTDEATQTKIKLMQG